MLYADATELKELQIGLENFRQAMAFNRAAGIKGGLGFSPPWHLQQLAGILRDSVKEEVGTASDAWGFVWHGTLQDSTATKRVSNTEVDIVQNSKGNFILYGTPPHPGADYAPRQLVLWAMDKYGLSEREAYPRARGIFRQGTLSKSRMHYPSGARGFNYAEWVVMVKERGTLMDYARIFADTMVKYLQIK
jgi:hypothetical protein